MSLDFQIHLKHGICTPWEPVILWFEVTNAGNKVATVPDFRATVNDAPRLYIKSKETGDTLCLNLFGVPQDERASLNTEGCAVTRSLGPGEIHVHELRLDPWVELVPGEFELSAKFMMKEEHYETGVIYLRIEEPTTTESSVALVPGCSFVSDLSANQLFHSEHIHALLRTSHRAAEPGDDELLLAGTKRSATIGPNARSLRSATRYFEEAPDRLQWVAWIEDDTLCTHQELAPETIQTFKLPGMNFELAGSPISLPDGSVEVFVLNKDCSVLSLIQFYQPVYNEIVFPNKPDNPENANRRQVPELDLSEFENMTDEELDAFDEDDDIEEDAISSHESPVGTEAPSPWTARQPELIWDISLPENIQSFASSVVSVKEGLRRILGFSISNEDDCTVHLASYIDRVKAPTFTEFLLPNNQLLKGIPLALAPAQNNCCLCSILIYNDHQRDKGPRFLIKRAELIINQHGRICVSEGNCIQPIEQVEDLPTKCAHAYFASGDKDPRWDVVLFDRNGARKIVKSRTGFSHSNIPGLNSSDLELVAFEKNTFSCFIKENGEISFICI